MTAAREKAFLLARPEQRLLEAIARRLPAWLLPDHLTALAVLAAAGFAAAGALSAHGTGWLWAAAGLLAMQWLGDSLDGTLARVRRAERPRYGYYLDHLADAVSTALIGLGLGLSPYMSLPIALVVVVAYLAASINTYLEAQAFGRMRLGYGRLGPTEARLVLLAALAAVASGAQVSLLGVSLLDLGGLAVAGVLVVAVGVRAAANLRVLGRREPARRYAA
jgi:archaetidylinositol phosphate synthase